MRTCRDVIYFPPLGTGPLIAGHFRNRLPAGEARAHSLQNVSEIRIQLCIHVRVVTRRNYADIIAFDKIISIRLAHLPARLRGINISALTYFAL